MPNGTSGTSTGFPIRWILIAIGAVVVIIIAIVAAKLISDRQGAGDKWDGDDEQDMSKVYARVSENESQTLKAAAAAASASAVIASKVKDEAKEETPAPELVEAAAVSEAAPEAVDEPTVQMAAPEVVDEPTVRVVAPEPVVLEGAHSRLVYDPATGEYKYELK